MLLIYSVGAYLLNNGQTDLIQTLGFVYAVPATLGGLALKYAELPPVPVKTTVHLLPATLAEPGMPLTPIPTQPEAEALRESKGTKVLKKIFSDATRFTYGDAHMEEPLKALKLAPRGMGPPTLIGLKEAVSPAGDAAPTARRRRAPPLPRRNLSERAPRDRLRWLRALDGLRSEEHAVPCLEGPRAQVPPRAQPTPRVHSQHGTRPQLGRPDARAQRHADLCRAGTRASSAPACAPSCARSPP